jgi:hypothetical protein
VDKTTKKQMKPQTLINKFREESFGGLLSRQLKADYGFCISRVNGTYTIIADSEFKLKSVYDDLVIIGYKYHTIVECPGNIWSITESNGWYYQPLNIEDEG